MDTIITSMDARTQTISLTVHQAEEVAESIKWIYESKDDMDKDELYIHRHLLAAYSSLTKQLKNVPDNNKQYNYPEPDGDPSY